MMPIAVIGFEASSALPIIVAYRQGACDTLPKIKHYLRASQRVKAGEESPHTRHKAKG